MAVPKNKNNKNKKKYFILKKRLKNKILSNLNLTSYKLKLKKIIPIFKLKK